MLFWLFCHGCMSKRVKVQAAMLWGSRISQLYAYCMQQYILCMAAAECAKSKKKKYAIWKAGYMSAAWWWHPLKLVSSRVIVQFQQTNLCWPAQSKPESHWDKCFTLKQTECSLCIWCTAWPKINECQVRNYQESSFSENDLPAVNTIQRF